DLRFYHHPTLGLKYDFILENGEEYTQIALRYEGLSNLQLKEGHLFLSTTIAVAVERPPVCYQTEKNEKTERKSAYVLDDNVLRFAIKKVKKGRPLLIDPNIVFSTFTGASSDNFGFTATYDDTDSSFYAGGIVYGPGYPTTTGAYQVAFGGLIDISLSKFDALGKNLVYSTFIGGSGPEQPHSMMVSPVNGDLVILGATASANYPVGSSFVMNGFQGGTPVNTAAINFTTGTDMCITRLSKSGNQLLGSTYLGGAANDAINVNLQFNYGDSNRGEVIVDGQDNVYVASSTLSSDFPTTANAHQPVAGSGQHGVVCKLTPNLGSLLWSTFLSGNGSDVLNGLQLNAAETTLFVAGATTSNNLPASANAYQPQKSGTLEDGIVAAFDPQTGSLQALTYNGTTARDQNFFVDVDFDGDVYIMGQTKGAYPISNAVFSVPNSPQFIQKLSPDLTSPLLSTTIGNGSLATFNFSPTAFMIDDCKNVFLSGWGGIVNFEGNTQNLPVTPDAYQSTTNGSDFYFAVLNNTWSALKYATYFGGTGSEHVDGGTSRFSKNGTIYQAICAGCGGSAYPTMPSDVHSTTNNSPNCNLAALKIEFDVVTLQLDVAISPVVGCAPFTLNVLDSSKNVHQMIWDYGDGTAPDTTLTPNFTYTQAGVYTILVTAIDTLCGGYDTTSFTIEVRDSDTTALDFTYQLDPCDPSQPVVFTYAGPPSDSLYWNFGDGTSATGAVVSHVFPGANDYVVTLTVKDSLCGGTATVSKTLSFQNTASPNNIQLRYDYCTDPFKVSFDAPYFGFQHVKWDFGNGDERRLHVGDYTFPSAGTYTVTVTLEDTICNRVYTQSFEIRVGNFSVEGILPNVFTPNGDGINDVFKMISEDNLLNFKDFELKIFNRWGQLLFQTRERRFQWDGRMNGKELSEGVYFWVIEMEDICGRQVDEKGIVHLTR
ncbi:MAG: gliding motility-associated C-terminal domain-containing protein, partial [Schleiferiaceae bacterium]|nr:gliding motility-associated C-terminal domain-containing protein [Schleiferiaceae bacterium]